MEIEQIVKCEVMLGKIFFPKGVNTVDSGEFAIFTSKVTKDIENCDMKNIKLKGNVCRMQYGSVYKVTCKLADMNEQYGNTYEILYINKKIDISSTEKQKEFLSNIINEGLVDKLFDMYTDVVSLLENKDIESLIKVKGIKKAKALRLIEEYEDSKDYSSIYTELGKLGLSSAMVKKLVGFYKSPDIVVSVIKNDPYDLVRVTGIGFVKADEIALKVGIGFNDYRRIKGFMIHTFIEQGEMGKSYLKYDELMNLIYATLGNVEQDAINKTAESLIKNNEIVILNNGDVIALKRYYDLEEKIFKELIRIRDAESNFNYGDINTIIENVEVEQEFEFTEEQRSSIELGVTNNVLAITGLAGSGKSSTAKGICALYANYEIVCVALSGKASVRITEATGLPASTIHRALCWDKGEFTYNKVTPLPCDVLLIDEATMINGDLFLSLLEAVPNGAKVIIMGDVQQLTPIGNCQVYADILNSEVIAVSKLTKPHRQALLSGIIPTSISIANQEQIFKSTFEGDMIVGTLQDMELDIKKEPMDLSEDVIKHFLKHYDKLQGDLMELQIVVPMRIRGSVSCYNLNTKIQKLINANMSFGKFIKIHLEGKKEEEKYYNIYVGDKVINTKNNYNCYNAEGEKIPVFNGNIGIIKEIDNGMCLVDFVGLGEILLSKEASRKLELAYASTVHKNQGSGYDTVIVAIDGSSYKLNNAELLYTAITRAKRYCVLVAKNSAVRSCISKREVKIKQTFLKQLLDKENV